MKLSQPSSDRVSADDLRAGARAAIVNRTHRVVREQALTMRAQRRRQRSLWVPIALCSTLLLTIVYAVWGLLDGYDLTPSGVPDASDQIFLVMLWSLPVTVVLMLLVWFRRGAKDTRGMGTEDLQ